MLRIFIAAFLLGCALAIQAQTISLERIESIDARVLNASTIVVGKLTSHTKDKPQNIQNVSFQVTETIRGNGKNSVTGRVKVDESLLNTWQEKSTPILVLQDTNENWIRTVDLSQVGKPIPGSDRTLTRDPLEVVSTEDFEILDTADKVLDYVRRLVKRNPTVTKTETVDVRVAQYGKGLAWHKKVGSHGQGGIILPVSPHLEKLAFDYIDHVGSIPEYSVVQMLKPFRSDENIVRMKKLLKDPEYRILTRAEDNGGMEMGVYPRRYIAGYVLRDWGIPVVDNYNPAEVSRIETLTKMIISWPRTFDSVKAATKLRDLTMNFTPIRNEDLETISKLTNLQKLSMNQVQLDDSRLYRLATLVNLTDLSLNGNPITDKYLDSLDSLKNLKTLSIINTQITEVGIAHLKQAHPNLQIIEK